jgi:hypothetical protein
VNFFEILYAQKNGAALPANFFDLLFAKGFTPAIEWGEYDGTLPAQYSANGSALADYRIYGAAGGVGDRTENGYVIPISVSDGTTSTTTQIYIGSDPLDAIGNYADYVDYREGKIVRSVLNYVFDGTEPVWRAINDWVELFASNITLNIVVNSDVRSQSPDGNVLFQSITYGGSPVIRITVDGISVAADIMPYLKSLYDNGTPAIMWYASLEPVEVDPPIPLPALPTINGTTITDYAGQSAAPSRFYAKYQKG